MAIALFWLFSALMNPTAALSNTESGSSPSVAPTVSLFTVSGDQRWRQIDFGLKPQEKKRSRREVLAAWLQSVRADGV